ncbi:Na+/H+ antiporter subunit C [Pontivivens insulae]|uniref:Na(+)/H(+) antiporter subunit C n=1 Tax=Pontivivens insulae TaxID=1639689 RepID=A0A2R8A6T5_9RHOB|nr:Na+/H+ antiporter subunit C [Pontivivens insulae]RED17838.1 multisubunit sodium/proton antiporter MrpC subunit [Pontivivens insulae]SPF27728.1 Na(+)/H(+) antiporter subunit C [Pontivivens insulae]
METVLAMLTGLLVAAGAYLMLSGNLVRYILGLALLSNAANLVIFGAGRLTKANPPLIPEGMKEPLEGAANALPQALILTAIVIGFGLFCFALALAYRAYYALGTARMDSMRIAEPREDS